MATRETKVLLKAQVDQYVADMDKAAKATRETGTEAEKLAQKGQAIRDLGVASMAMGTLAAAGVALAVSKWADFDQAMSQVQAATGEGEEGMKALSEAALDAGARTVFSAEEAANAIEELAKAGVDTADILSGGLDGALDLAAAGGLGVADAAGIAATALKTFNLEGSDMGHVADLLAAGAGKAMGDVTDLAGALNQSAMVANATGLSIEETTATLAAFASQGLLGSDAGTSFKSMLQSLTPTSVKAREAMDDLGISAYDAQGNFVGMAEFAGNLQSGLKDLSVEQQQAALKTIFGSDAIRAATVLYTEGAEGIQKWEDAVNDQGFAAEQAAMRLDNLKGDIEALGGALDTALIKTGSGANDALRTMVQWLSAAVDAYADLPAPLQSAALGVGIVTAAVGLLGGGAVLTTIKVAELRRSLAILGVTGASARASLMGFLRFLGGPWGVALIAATASIAVFNNAMDASKTSAKTLESAIKQGSDALTAMRATAEKNEQGITQVFVDVSQHAEKLPALLDKAATSGRGFFSGLSFNEQAMLDNLGELGDYLTGLAGTDFPRASDEFREFSESAKLSKEQMQVALGEMPGFKSELLDIAEAAGLATDDNTLLSIAMGEIGPASTASSEAATANAEALAALQGKAADAEGAISDLADMIRGFGSAELDAREANRQLEESFDQLSESIKDNGATLKIGTAEGRANQSALDDVAKSTIEAAAATAVQTGSHAKATAVMQKGRDELIKMLDQFGITGAKAEKYADKLGLIPENISTAVEVNTDPAQRAVDAFIAANSQRTVRIAVGAGGQGGQVMADGGIIQYANGGMHDFANGGGVQTGIYSGGTPIIKFAEPETGWEAFISGKPSERDRNRQIWVESGSRLGMNPGGQHTVQVPVSVTVVDADGVFVGTFETVAAKAIQRATRSVSSQSLKSALGV